MPPKNATQTPATTRLARCVLRSIAGFAFTVSRASMEEARRHAHHAHEIDDDDKRAERQRERDGAAAPRLELGIGRFDGLDHSLHAPATTRATTASPR